MPKAIIVFVAVFALVFNARICFAAEEAGPVNGLPWLHEGSVSGDILHIKESP